MAGDAFVSPENMTGATKVQKMNQKTRFRGTGAEISAMSGNDGPHAGQEAFCSATGSGFTIDRIFRRNNANSAWVELYDVANTRSPNATLFDGFARNRFDGQVDNEFYTWIFDRPVLADNHPWDSAVSGAVVSIQEGNHGFVRIACSADGNLGYIKHADKFNFQRNNLAVFEILLIPGNVANHFEQRFGFTSADYSGANAWPISPSHFACYEVDTTKNGDANVYIQSSDNSTISSKDTGYLVVAAPELWRLELDDSPNEIRLYRNNVLLDTKTTNLPGNTTNLQPFCYMERVSSNTRNMDIKSISLRQTFQSVTP